MGILLTEGADTAATASSMGLIGSILIMVLMYAVLWFFIMRPQKKEQKKLAAMVASLEIGDCVLTTGGMIGIVIDITDDTIIVEFGNNKNCRIPMEKTAISRVEKPGEAKSKTESHLKQNRKCQKVQSGIHARLHFFCAII